MLFYVKLTRSFKTYAQVKQDCTSSAPFLVAFSHFLYLSTSINLLDEAESSED